MVVFHDNPDKYDSTGTVERLQKEVPNNHLHTFSYYVNQD